MSEITHSRPRGFHPCLPTCEIDAGQCVPCVESWKRKVIEAKQRRHRRVEYSIGLFLAMIVAIAFLEISVRTFFPQKEPAFWLRPDATYGHVAKPNFSQDYHFLGGQFVMNVRTNSAGLRDAEIVPPSEGQKTILFVGDSFTFGFGANIEERFDTRLRAKLEHAGYDFRYINAGVDGWGTLQATQFARDNFGVFQPDIVVLTFCENDPYDNAYYLENKETFGSVRLPLKQVFRRYLHLYRLVQYVHWVNTHKASINGLAVSEGDPTETTPDPQRLLTIPDHLWPTTRQAIVDFHAELKRFNPDAVLLIQASAPTSHDIRNRLKSLDNGNDLLYVDMHDTASKMTLEQRRLTFDPHWSPAMQEVSAQHLSDEIVRLECREQDASLRNIA